MEMNAVNLKIGTRECPIRYIASILHQNPSFQENWLSFAKGLDIHQKKITWYDITCNVIELWVGREGSRATLSALFQVMEENGISGDAEESIRLELKLPCKGADNKSSLSWTDLSPSFQKRVADNFKQQLPTLTLDDVVPSLNGDLLVDLMTGKELPIFKETIPEPLSYYVDRKIISRSYISKSICQQYSLDTFLFTGIDRYQLARLTAGQPVRGSSDQLKGVTAKFIILDHPTHFERISMRVDNPIHLLHFENERLVWIKSKGELTTLQKYVDKCQHTQGENDFCLHLNPNCNLPICIADSPGMGKSILLAQMGRRLRKLTPDRTVILIVLTEFIERYKLIPKRSMVAAIEETLMKMVCKNEVGRAIIQTKLSAREGIEIELLFDGFDEVSSKDEKLAYAILQTIKDTFKIIRIWLTSRPQYLEQLENNLGTFGYNIEPFDESNQLRFLTSSWARDTQQTKNEFEEFARQTLGMVKANMNLMEQDIAGIPLQCLLIGELYEDEAIAFVSNPGRQHLIHPITHINSIADLYKFTIARKFDKYLRLHVSEDFCGIDVLMDRHVLLSVQLLFPDSSIILKEELVTGSDGFEVLLKIGLLESSRTTAGSARFIHRTFAEYFIAWFVVERLKKRNSCGVDLSRFVFNTILFIVRVKVGPTYWGFAHPVITYFFNYLLENDITSNPSPSNGYFPQDVAISEETRRQVAHACAYHDFVHIFNFFDGKNLFITYASSIFDGKFLIVAIDNSFVPLIRISMARFEAHHEFNNQIQTQVIRRAAQRGEFSVLEYLIKEKGLRTIVKEVTEETNGLIMICLIGSHEATAREIGQNKETIRLLVQINPDLLEAKSSHDIRTPLLSPATHVKLLIALIQLGANVLAEDEENATVLHVLGQDFTSEDYHSLVSSIPLDKLKELVHIKAPLGMLLNFFDPVPETLDIFKAAGVDFNDPFAEEVTDGYSVLANAVRWGRNKATLTKLVQHGADTEWTRFGTGEGLLHVAADSGNLEALKFFIGEIGMNVNALDGNGQNPLYYSIHSESDTGQLLECGLFLHDIGCLYQDISIPNSEEQSLLHKAALNGSFPVVKLLLHFDVEVNSPDRNGNTPLHLGVAYKWQKDYSVVKLLLDKGANPNVWERLRSGMESEMEIWTLEYFSFLRVRQIWPGLNNGPLQP